MTRKAIPVYQRSNVRKKTTAATMTAGISIQMARTMSRMIAIPMITSARKPRKEITSTYITRIPIYLNPEKCCA
jgi:hypothetical protein